ncbi:hypothetical protein J3R08_001934 [Micromonospora sp. HB375]|nr:hypothetical protein [Micromonospora sp. HB375]
MHIDATRNDDLSSGVDLLDISRWRNPADTFDAAGVNEHVSAVDTVLGDHRASDKTNPSGHLFPVRCR